MHATPPSDRVGEAIKAHMAQTDVTQLALAAALGMAQPTLSRKLNGDVQLTLGELFRIADALHVDVAEFLGAAA